MALRGPVICTRRLKGEGLEGRGAVQPRLILASQNALRIACRTSCHFGDDSFDARSMISETVENSAGSRKADSPGSVLRVESGRWRLAFAEAGQHAVRGWVSSGDFLCRLQTVPKTPIPGRPPARRARARSAWPDPCATGRRPAVQLCLISLAPSRQGHSRPLVRGWNEAEPSPQAARGAAIVEASSSSAA